MRAIGTLGTAALRKLWLLRNRKSFRDPDRSRRPRLLVDVSVIMRHDAATGIQRVVRAVWSQLAKLSMEDFEVVPVHASATHGYCFAPRDFLSRGAAGKPVPVGAAPGDKFLGLDLAAHYLPAYANQLAAWRRNGATLHVVVYDLLPLERPDWFEQSTSHHFRRWFAVVMNQADQALCISDSVAQEFRRRTIGTTAHDRIRVGRLRLSGDISGSVPSTGISESALRVIEHVRKRPCVLMIGTVEPRKNYDHALDAFARLWADEQNGAPDLVIVGKPGWKTSALQERLRNHREHGRRLHWIADVSDEALTMLYQSAEAVFLAAFDEGFGLPLVEAATHGRWILVRDLPVFREQQLPNVRYFVMGARQWRDSRGNHEVD